MRTQEKKEEFASHDASEKKNCAPPLPPFDKPEISQLTKPQLPDGGEGRV